VDKAVILIAHGSRVASTALEMDQIITKMRQSGLSCYPAYMEIQQPSLMDTVESLVSQGVSEVAILPLFFFIGRHLRDDIPEQLKQCRERWRITANYCNDTNHPRIDGPHGCSLAKYEGC